jgi:tol-pal system protein YbgF
MRAPHPSRLYSFFYLSFCGASLFALGACRTSGDIATGRDDRYVDPTNVQTIDTPPSATAGMAPVPGSPDQLQAELAVARGDLENVKYASAQEEAQLRARIAELEAANQRLIQENSQLHGGAPAEPNAAASNAASTGVMSPVVTPAPGSASTHQKPIEVHGAMPEKSGAPLLWELAQSDLKAGRYEKALSPLGELAKTYPKDPLALYALLGAGMAQYHLKQYSDAAVTFNQVIDKFPKKKETGIAWFGQGAAFVALKQNDDAKVLLQEVARRYPNSTEASAAKRMLKHKEKAPSDLFAIFPSWDKKAKR